MVRLSLLAFPDSSCILLPVRNRARELVELLSDVETIRTERRKAKTNRGKYTGTGNDPMSFTSGGGRYGGFGNDSLGSSGYYGDRMSGRDGKWCILSSRARLIHLVRLLFWWQFGRLQGQQWSAGFRRVHCWR